ncbi:CHAT domain-containing protein [Kitasatospora sp. NPDC092948]|uniref:CHAT domain-containing protein n=1 Tax=Kitasatospora sp. NPDC092948 TaxID=3364088 RepID=UPI003827DC50
MSPDEGEPSDDELRALRAELLAELADGDDPDGPAKWATAADRSYELYLRRNAAAELELADDCFARAFARPGGEEIWDAWRIVHAHVLLLKYDLGPDHDLAERAHALLRAGLAGLADDSPFAHLGVLGRYLLTRLGLLRWSDAADQPADVRRELLTEAVRLHGAALADQEPGSAVAAELHGELGGLHHERHRIAGDLPDAEASARHYREALAAPAPDSDVALLHYGLATALMVHGRQAVDRDLLTDARAEFGRALVAAGGPTAERPWWGREAAARMVHIRAVLWWEWDDATQVGPGVAELEPLLAEPDALDELSPPILESFGRLIYQRATERADDADRDRALGLMQHALDRWRPDRDGSPGSLGLLVAALQQARYRTDADPHRLPAVLAGSGLALREADGRPVEFHRTAVSFHAWARHEAVQRGIAAPDPESDALFQDAFRAVMETLHGVEQGEAFLNLGDDEFNGLVNEVADSRQLPLQFDRMYRQWLDLDPAGRQSEETAAFLLSMVPTLDPHGTHVTAEQKDALLRAGLKARQDDPVGLSALHVVAGTLKLHDGAAGDGSGLEEALQYLDTAGAIADGRDQRLTDGVKVLRSLALGQRGQMLGGYDEIAAAATAIADVRDQAGSGPYLQLLLDAQLAGLEALQHARRGDLHGTDRCLARLTRAYAELNPDSPARGEIWTMVENTRTARDQLARAAGAPPSTEPHNAPSGTELRRLAARLPRNRHAWVLGDAGIARCVRAFDRDDLRGLEAAMELLREALTLVDEGSDDWLRYASCLANGHCAKASRLQDRRELETGIALMEQAARTAAGPEHRLWATIGLSLARAYRLRADPARDDRRHGRHAGLESLRGHTWAALLQSGTGHAAEAAREATECALEVAAWCLADDVPEDAVQALDACRGLVLHAATTSMSLPDLLTAAGRSDLADEWRSAGADGPADTAAPVPSELRRRVLTALTADRTADTLPSRLLDPPTPDEIAAALRSLRADALVYLVPASDERGGAAVLVAADGGVHWLPLPLLKEDAGPLRDYRPGGPSVRDMGPVPHSTGPADPPDVPLRRQLDRLCSWAWYAAMKPLLELLVPPPGRTRPPSLILVPMGTLGTVPWHAAWSEPHAPGARRYAVERAEISYAASARLLCEVAARPAAPHTGSALIVGNPTGDLWHAGEEADAVQRTFYPHGSYLGRRPAGRADGPGTPDGVLGWLRRDTPGGVLHLACHANVAVNERHSSYLSLSGGELAAEELTEAAGRGGGLELVLLAACRSHISGRGHNESYSLATAFLVAGARSVVGSLWPVPDDATSVLMFMTHHFLRREVELPGRALRRAQLWMIDPGRVLPADLPGPMADRAAAVDPDDLSAWAGFTHLGQ